MTEGASGFRGAGLVLATKDFECGAFASAWLAALPEPACSRVLRCRSPRRRLESLAARTALFMLLARFGIRPEGWREAPPAGPLVETPTGTLHATLSHTSGRAAALAEKVQEAFPDCDVDFHYGGQPVYYYMISAE